ncbi:DUF4089 domain-containing protein [Leptolyngbya sp. AN02str]|uniref:DUF4089 domain-containing protein n=1 Tax=Leptolyngbya sp. AN02str TaxID=3423363 RepID=UPI003D31F9A1
MTTSSEPNFLSMEPSMEQYVDQTAAVIGLPIPSEYRAEVIANFARTAAIAQLVLEFPLPPEVEAAPTFQP